MSSFLWFLNLKAGVRAFLLSRTIPDCIPTGLSGFIIPDIHIKPDLIIRDMRDSTEEEIRQLQKAGRVLVIDDNGEGRNKADFIVDLLPNPETGVKKAARRKEFFIYGYNFLNTLSGLSGKKIIKNIDFAVYPGFSDVQHIKYLASLMPHNSCYAVLGGKTAYLHQGEIQEPLDMSYAEIILSSKIIISHFGILLYEGKLAECRLITINPSLYHSQLADMESENLELINLGEESMINKETAAGTILSVLRECPAGEITADEIYKKAISNLENFYAFIRGLIS